MKTQRILQAMGALLALMIAAGPAQGDTPAPCCNTCGPTDPPPCSDAGTGGKFSALTGDEQRSVRDLEVWGGVGEDSLAFTRYGHSRVINAPAWFGQGHIWRHSYQWDLVDGGPGALTLYYPEGTVYNYTLSGDTWAGIAKNPDLLTQAGNGYTLQRANGWRYNFVKAVTSGPNLQGAWLFDENTGTIANDASGNGRTGTLVNGPTWGTGASGSALSFNGANQSVSVNSSVVDTRSDFTVSAWVRLDSSAKFSTAVSQDGNSVSGFYLQYAPDVKRFSFTLQSSDSTTSTATRATNNWQPSLGAWYHLVGVRDAAHGQILLYVNGALIGTQTYTAQWNATGNTMIGRAKWNNPTDFWPGRVDEVRLYNRALSASEIATLYSGSVTYQMQSFTDSASNVYTLNYDANGRVTRVTEPAGRYLQINYQDMPINSESFVTLAKQSGNPAYTWNEIAVTDTNAYRYLRYYTGGDGTVNGFCNIAEAEFYDMNTNKLTGAAFGTNPSWGNNPATTYEKASDGNTNSFFDYAYVHFGFTGIDLGAGNARRISKVRFVPRPGNAARMNGGMFQGANTAPATVPVIASVQSSDGRSVTYSYTTISDPVLQANWLVLSAATYGDGTQAAYNYSLVWPGQRPLLTEANDPRVLGAGTHLQWDYWQNGWVYGSLYQEKDGVSGAVIAKLEGNGGDWTSTQTKVTYANGAVVNFTHDGTGNLTRRADGLGRVTTAAYTANNTGFLASQTDLLGRTTTYTRDAQGRPLTTTNPDNSTTSATYDSLGRVLSRTDELGHITTYTRDGQGRVTRVDYPDSSYETFTYNTFGQVLTHRQKNGGTESFTYEARGLKTLSTDALGNSTSYAYNTNDLLAAVTDAVGNTTSFAYDEKGQGTTIQNPDTSIRTVAYDAYGSKTNETDELGHATAATYDEFKRITSLTDALGRSTLYSYDLPGRGGCGCSGSQNQPTQITSPSGKVTTFSYDLEWQKISETAGYGTVDAATTQYQYDTAGNLLATIDPRGHTWSNTYDSRNRPVTSRNPFGNTTTSTYDGAGNNLTVTRPDGGATVNAYDNLNRLAQSTDPKSQVTTFSYDAAGNMTMLTDANSHSYSFTYDLLNRRTSMIYPDASHEDYAYDSAGNLAAYRNRAGNVRSYTYDNRNRETHSEWNDSVTPAIDRTYDAAGRLLTLDNSVSCLTYTYDAANQLLGESQDIGCAGALQADVSYSYDLDGNRSSLTYPDSTVVTNAYTARNQLATETIIGAGTPLVQYQYDATGNRVKKTLGNGTTASYVYDNSNRLLSLLHSNSAGQFTRFDYTLNSVGNRTSKTQTSTGVFPVLSEAYAYDAIDQVTGVNCATNSIANRSVSYQYDSVGNRQQVVDNSATIPYSANNLNQYTVVNGGTLTYDANGNLTSQNGWLYTYDSQNRLVAAASNGVTIAMFAYDARNRCVARTINSTTTYLTYDGWSLIEERNNNGAVLDKYVHGAQIDEILVRYNGGPIYYHHDGLGSVTHLSNGSGAILESYSYDVYGAAAIYDSNFIPQASSVASNRFLITGREYISQLGLCDFRNRSYVPTLGRFVQTDPFGLVDGDLNLYRYADNNPANEVDPFGLLAAVGLPAAHRSATRHDNYLTWTIKCKKDCKVANVTVDYSSVAALLSPFHLPYGSSLGAIRSIAGVNCAGDPVTVTAFMRTRLTAPYAPGGGQNTAAYVAGTNLFYDCIKCE